MDNFLKRWKKAAKEDAAARKLLEKEDREARKFIDENTKKTMALFKEAKAHAEKAKEQEQYHFDM